MVQCTNSLLASMGPEVGRIGPHLRQVFIRPGQTLCEPGQKISHVYFLHSGLVSKMAVFEDGTEIECAMVGSDGGVGIMSALGLTTAVTRDVCHVGGQAACIEVEKLQAAARASPVIDEALNRYCVWKMNTVIRNGACNARHSVEQRLSRWLLTSSDILGDDEIPLSQEVFASMLGVQRSSINPSLKHLRDRGLIATKRACVRLLDRTGLRRKTCECYEAIGHASREVYLEPAPAGRRFGLGAVSG
jgi:CRP-like cAMP-binding protein